jgi:anthranilate synthase/aminodeoxychorismate synthase-like glutamine amidotransferase
MAQALGGRIIRADTIMHGKTSLIYHDGRTIFRGIRNPFQATRYHSLIVERESLPACFEVSATTDDGTIMGIRHQTQPLEGVQFHPESIMTEEGKALLRNFLQ